VKLKIFFIEIRKFKMSSNTVCFGCDLGTSESVASIWENNRVEILTNECGSRTTRSMVAFTDTERLIGESAKNQCAMNPKNTVYEAKRLIGRRFSDPTVQSDIKRFPFKVIDDGKDRPLIEVQFKGETKHFYPEEISAMVLSKMKEIVEAHTGKQARDVVIGIPAYFGDSQKQATKDAAKIAGLNVLRLIAEPTSSAIAYNFDKVKDDKEHLILVFDMGGEINTASWSETLHFRKSTLFC
jgi:heat shock protein 1/8